MVKFFIGLLILIILVLGAVLLVQKDPGFVLIRYADFSIETSLAFGIVAVVAAGLLIQLLLRLLLALWRLPKTLARRSEQRRIEKSRKLLNIGLIDLAEGRFEQAENNLIKLIDYAENPLLNYLAAARAAQFQSKYDQRDNYLKQAHEAKPEAEIAIGVTQAELQLVSRQTERALATLTHLRSIAPKHDYVLKLLAKVYSQIEEWTLLCELLPEVRKKKLFSDNQLQDLETRTYTGCLDDAAARGDGELDRTWLGLPKSAQTNTQLILHYIELVQSYKLDADSIEQIVVKSINQQWNNDLVDFYGRLQVGDTTAQLNTAEKWLADYAGNDVLLLALGRICIRLRLWGKAQKYLEASLSARPNGYAYLELAELLSREELGDPKRASTYYQKGLQLCLKPGQLEGEH